MSAQYRAAVTAVLGPTNTGKTHLAIERMLGHSSGMMGFPLRLLAREVYDRIVAARGVDAVALLTGEERIRPANARYFLCTAEAMPKGAGLDDGASVGPGASPRSDTGTAPDDVAFLALDEAQIGQDRERGHVFTTRMLHARGREETMILGSASLGPVVRHLLPHADITARPRFSTLRYDGPKKLSRLPPRTVIVAFSAEEVYAIAEALRRFSGGAAVVMGALSPRTRNAQVAMFQAGEVDYLVATDAIGMGLNLDVGHVMFASLTKFDGQRHRRLTVAEMAQIAGRAGRHQRDGGFGSIGAEAAFEPEEIEAIEGHRFAPLDWLYWRNPAPDTASVAALIASLEAPPPDVMLRTAPEATDMAVLRRLAEDAEALALVDGPAMVRRLWSACSLPDFRKSGPEAHGRFVTRLWQDLGRGHGHIDGDWFGKQLGALDDVEGSVEKLADRIAAVRSWCYIANRADWLAHPDDHAADARAIETRLSDALHAALTARFVDRRTTVLMRALGQGAGSLPVAVSADGAVAVDGEVIGVLDGFRFSVDPAARAADRRMLFAAAERHLAVELASRATALANSANDHLALDLVAGEPPALTWHGRRVATLVRGRNRLAPRILLDRDIAALDPQVIAAVVARLKLFVDDRVAADLAPMLAIAGRARDAAASAALRAVLAGLFDAGGTIARDAVDAPLRALTPDERLELRRLQVRIGSLDLFVPQSLRPRSLAWLNALDAAWHDTAAVPALPPGIAIVAAGDAAPPPIGFRRINDVWLRADLVERVCAHAHAARAPDNPVAIKAAQARAARRAKLLAKRARVAVGAGEPVPADAPADAPTDAPADASDVAASPVPPMAPSPPVPPMAPSPPVPHAFRVDPEMARSIGLGLEDRLTLLRLLGFRTHHAIGQVTIESEPDLWWTWHHRPNAAQAGRARGDDAPRERRPRRRAKRPSDRPAALSTGSAASTGSAQPAGAAQPAGDAGAPGRTPRSAPPAAPPAKRPAQPSPRPPQQRRAVPRRDIPLTAEQGNPFAALAGLFDKPGGSKGGDG